MLNRATRFAVVAALTAFGCGGPATSSNLAPNGNVTGSTAPPSTVPRTAEPDLTDDEEADEGAEPSRNAQETQPAQESEEPSASAGPALEVTTDSLKPIASDRDSVLIATHLFIRNVSSAPADAPLMRVRTQVLADNGPRACAPHSQHALGTLRDIAPGEVRKVVALSVCERPEHAEATAVGFVEFEDEGRDGPHFLGRVAIRPIADDEATTDDPAPERAAPDA